MQIFSFGSLLVLGIGFSSAQLDSTSVLIFGLNDFEAVDLPDSDDDTIEKCPNQVPDYPIAAKLFEPSYTFIDDTVMVCGGFDGVVSYRECYGISPEQDGWIQMESMIDPVFRTGFAKFGSLEEGGEFFWVAGGTMNGVDPLTSSAIYDAKLGNWFEGPELPIALDGPCFASLNNSHTLITGGHQQGGSANWIYDFDSDTFTEVGSFVGGNRFVHGCATLTDGRVMVAGGYQLVPEAKVLNTVEFFDPITLTWSEGSSFPGDGRDGLLLVGVTSGAWAGDVLLIGGHIPDSITGGDWIESDEVSRYSAAEDLWEVLDFKMKVPREHFAVISTPYHCDDKK